MRDGRDYACPFHGLGCDHRAVSVVGLKKHMREHPREVKIVHNSLGVFWGPLVYSYVRNNQWPKIGQIIGARLPDPFGRICRLDREET
jgi:hypothetical protein